jgi:hypothetical protein
VQEEEAMLWESESIKDDENQLNQHLRHYLGFLLEVCPAEPPERENISARVRFTFGHWVE